MSLGALAAGVWLGALFGSSSLAASDGAIPIDRAFERLPSPEGAGGARATLAAAGGELGAWTLDLAGTPVDGALLLRLAKTPADEPLLRAAREQLRRPVDLDDFLLFLDDVVVAGERGLYGKPVVLTAERARKHGVFIHPDEVFKGRARVYGEKGGELPIDPPPEQRSFSAPPDGAPLGPAWTVRYPNPEEEGELLEALRASRPDDDLDARIGALVGQLRAQGAEVTLVSTVRSRERGYLMYGAYWLAQVRGPAQLKARVRTLEKLKRRWQLDVPIAWRHPKGWRATREAARQMAEAYNVVYATRAGAKRSHHYDGLAFDCTVVNLPRALTLTAPDGATTTFDLSAEGETRDLSTSPALIAWIEEHFSLEKLEDDYPHWEDRGAAP